MDPNQKSNEPHSLPPEQRLESVLSFAFRGIHHAGKIKRHEPAYWETSVYGGLATTDWDQLTRLVFAAHKYAVRVEIESSGPRMVKIKLHARKRTGSIYERHPTLEDAIAAYNA